MKEMDNGTYLMIALLFVVGAEIAVIFKKGDGWTDNSVRLVGLTIVGFLAVLIGFFVNLDPATTAAYAVLGMVAGHLATRAKDN